MSAPGGSRERTGAVAPTPTEAAVADDDARGLARLGTVVQEVLELARKAGASAAEVGASRETGLTVSVREQSLENLEFTREVGLGVTVYFGRRKGSASTSDLSGDALAATVRAASEIARRTAEDPANGLAEADLMAGAAVELDLYHPWTLTPEAATDLALACEQAALDADPRIGVSEGASVSTSRSGRVYANSHGFSGALMGTRHSLGCVVVAADGGDKQRDGFYDLGRRADALEDARALGREAGTRAAARLGAAGVPTTTAPVLFRRDLAAGLLGSLVSAMSGASLYRRSSFLLDAMGEAVLPARYDLAEHPHEPGGLASTWFDGDGVATRPNRFVEGGRLRSWVLSAYSARRLGLETTGNAGGVHNLRLDDDGLDFEALLRELDTGLLVTELMGQGVNLVTGDYSRGAAGFWVEGGRIAKPVQEVTIAGNLRDMFRDLVAVGNDREWRSTISTGSLLIGSMKIAGR